MPYFLATVLKITKITTPNTLQVVMGSDGHILHAQFVLAALVTATQNGVEIFFPKNRFQREVNYQRLDANFCIVRPHVPPNTLLYVLKSLVEQPG